MSTSSLVASKESFQRTRHQKSPRRRIETRTQQPLSSDCSRPLLRKRFFASSHAALVAASQHSDLSSLDRGPSRSNGGSEMQAATSPSATCRNRQMFSRPIGSPLACADVIEAALVPRDAGRDAWTHTGGSEGLLIRLDGLCSPMTSSPASWNDGFSADSFQSGIPQICQLVPQQLKQFNHLR